jgi:hypothetical protein
MAFVGTIYKDKVVKRCLFSFLICYPNITLRMNRIRIAHKAELSELLHENDLLDEYGGKWSPDPKKEWIDPTLERYRPKGPVNAWK